MTTRGVTRFGGSHSHRPEPVTITSITPSSSKIPMLDFVAFSSFENAVADLIRHAVLLLFLKGGLHTIQWCLEHLHHMKRFLQCFLCFPLRRSHLGVEERMRGCKGGVSFQCKGGVGAEQGVAKGVSVRGVCQHKVIHSKNQQIVNHTNGPQNGLDGPEEWAVGFESRERRAMQVHFQVLVQLDKFCNLDLFTPWGICNLVTVVLQGCMDLLYRWICQGTCRG